MAHDPVTPPGSAASGSTAPGSTAPGRHSAATARSRPRPNKWWSLIVLAVGLAMIVMDGTIVAVSMTTIIADLGLDLTDAQWVNSLYSVVLAALLLTAGSLGDRYGRRRLFVLGIALFVAGSIWAGSAHDAAGLISARVLQGIGGACILPSTLSTVNDTFRGKDRAAAFGVWGAVISGAAALGPLLGGWLTSTFSWEWIFLVNVPVGVLVIIAAFVAIPETTAPATRHGYDVQGLVLSFLGFGLLVFAVIEGSSLGWWMPLTDLSLLGLTWPTSMPISIVPILLAVSLVSLLGFGLWERHRARVRRSALLNLELFAIPTFSLGNVAAMMIAIGEFGLIFVLPLFLINAAALGIMATGWVLAAMALGAFFSGAMARHIAARIGASGTVLVGVSLEVVGVVVLALTIHPGTSPVLVAAILVVYGIGLGLASAQLTSTILQDVPLSSSGPGSATQSTVRQVGAAIGAAVAGSVLSLGLAHHLGSVAGPAAQLADATRSSAGGVISGLREQGAPEAVVGTLANGFADATRWTMYSTAGFLLLGLIASVAVWVAARAETSGSAGPPLAQQADRQD